MKNPFTKYIDKRIEETLKRKEREAEEEKERIERLQAKRKKEEELHARAKLYLEKLISEGTVSVSHNLEFSYHHSNIPYEERDSTIVSAKIRALISEDIFTKLFIEDLGRSWTNYVTFSLSEGLKADLQKLHNIKPKEK